jgi:hypothetical protein
MSEIRNQGNRPTCVAFSSLAAFEHNVRKHPAPFAFLNDLNDCSEQSLYFRCKKSDGNIQPGTLVSTAYRSLANDGTVPEFDWPYQSPADPNDPGTPLPILPEAGLLLIGSQTRIQEDRALNGKSVFGGLLVVGGRVEWCLSSTTTEGLFQLRNHNAA